MPIEYPEAVFVHEATLVDVVREFLASHALLTDVIQRCRSRTLEWDDVQKLVGEDESSLLFRLKERSHHLVRARDAGDDLSRIALFDLAVGSLFHEAMKLRENFYQLVVYAPKVERARHAAGPGSEALFSEFSRILKASKDRLDEAVEESAALLDQTRDPFRELLVEHRHDGAVGRYLLANRSATEAVLGEPLDVFFAQAYGEAALGYAAVARSYLQSGFFREALLPLEEALARKPDDTTLRGDRVYAMGMEAYLRGNYDEALFRLERWVRDEPAPKEVIFRDLATEALAGLAHVVVERELIDRAEILRLEIAS